ncbi:MBL fold metallo-hydrolase [Uruburuella testudinis]|uniref:MBL fold metallo-hydrolase n=1 Tax=Uruburuella testudinis TaxID=1282863 RepID=A0ABY4DVP1_9NEIS|nr:MBL fold metallo-hydrolase [Uruburuella testudinis]UOO82898.1 MBL fold metallo-hydrolase [Uruburuella testudinis]
MKLHQMVNALTASLALAAASTAAAHALPEHTAPARVQEQQVAGYFRLPLDKGVTVTALYDGPVNLPHQWLRGISLNEAKDVFNALFLPLTAEGVQTSVNAYLLNQNGRYTLIDAGASNCLGDGLGHMLDNLKASGVQPEQISSVLVTHLHPDHACGVTTDEGTIAFPNAVLYAPEDDADYWLGGKVAQSRSEHDQAFFKAAVAAVAPYRAAGRFRTFKRGENPIHGIETVDEAGHSPGMTGYLLGSGSQRLLVWGDIIHSHSIQLKNPDISVEVDSDQPKAIATRKRILNLVEQQRLWVGAAHLPFPGIGHIVKDGKGYRWLPAEFLPLK